MTEPNVNFDWEDSGIAGVTIECVCGEVYDTTVSPEGDFVCDKCGLTIEFTWKGMEYKVVKK